MLVAVDAAGGDYAPHEIVKGALAAAEQFGIEVALVGRKTSLRMLERRLNIKSSLQIFNAREIIGFHDHPVQAVRNKRDSSIVVGTKLVRDGLVSAFVSAGNTGAVLAAAYLYSRKYNKIERPCLCGVIGINPLKPILLIDAGANADCRPEYLRQFAELGNLFAIKILGISSPRIALLNIGAEESKGNTLVKDTYQLLKNSKMNFIGNIEGHEILREKTDVIVTDGFTGNVLLKTMEGFGELFGEIINPQSAAQVVSGLQGPALIHYSALISKARHMDYKEYGGACLLGLDSNIIVAHGRSQSTAIKNAIHLAYQVCKTGVADTIKSEFD
ncbi:MAG TPA: phosphate acyltransferase PlsX [Dehalococcoidia bacterium]|nr:phosphate acyltransferase PlsX [Dehalococcoidia bacterium]